jgi:large subunit ribosomal protein L9
MSQLQVILLERVENLGQMGDVVKVKMGYARNYLLPHKKALRATKDNVTYFEGRRAQLEADNLKRKGEAEGVAGKMDKARVSMVRQAGESGQLYGSVGARDIAEGLTAAGYTVDKRQVVIGKPIKTIGIHNVRVVLHPEVSVTALVNVAQSDEEAKLQFERFDRGESPVVLKNEQDAAEAAAIAAEQMFDKAPTEGTPAAEADAPTAKADAEAPAEKPAKAKKAKAEADAEPAEDDKKGKKDKEKKGKK